MVYDCVLLSFERIFECSSYYFELLGVVFMRVCFVAGLCLLVVGNCLQLVCWCVGEFLGFPRVIGWFVLLLFCLYSVLMVCLGLRYWAVTLRGYCLVVMFSY